jgi:uncharacterized membrane protein YphA (DoxX/SURF4 family)
LNIVTVKYLLAMVVRMTVVAPMLIIIGLLSRIISLVTHINHVRLKK